MTDLTFIAWPKTPRLFTEVTITEKLDGTNGCIVITDDGQIGAQSRKRMLPMGPRGMDDVTWEKEDNAGFAAWVRKHSDALVETLGPGHHYGEWWGSGIQRGYGLANGDKRFSLFNTAKWEHLATDSPIAGLGVVPILYQGDFAQVHVQATVLGLVVEGSKAAPGYMRPEGVCVFHKQAGQVFKVIIDK